MPSPFPRSDAAVHPTAATGPFDPRAVANLILDQAAMDQIALTNLSLQKLLYFAHAIFLIRNTRPLVFGYFEAWKYGPVHPTAYMAFKDAGDKPINFRAKRKDVLSGRLTEIAPPADPHLRQHIREVMGNYGRLTPGRLVDISHAKGAPWHVIFEKSRVSVAFGLRIPDNVIREHFRRHKVTVGDRPSSGEPREDTPPA
jgi:uncharacterized phage-associated protein